MYALVDCNNFFVSCERVFAPQWEGKPVIVLSNNDGCIISRSQEAKAIGIAMGAPFFEEKERIKEYGVKAFSSNYSLYGNLSNRVMATIKAVHPLVEVYSIDEAFVDLQHVSLEKLQKKGEEIKSRIWQWVGIPVSVGIAPTKTLAKIAAEKAKKDFRYHGVCVVIDDEEKKAMLKKTPIGDVWGIGRGYTRTLLNEQVYTAYHFTLLPETAVKSMMGVVGYRTMLELKGYPCTGIEIFRDIRKSIMSSRSFGRAVTTLESMKEATATYTVRSAEKLRKECLLAGMITVFIHTSRHKTAERQYSASHTEVLRVPTDDTLELVKVASEITDRIFRQGYRYKKAGVLLTGLVKKNGLQYSLYENTSFDKRLSATIDALNSKGEVVKIAATGLKRNWKMRSEKRSPNYLTDWNDVLGVK